MLKYNAGGRGQRGAREREREREKRKDRGPSPVHSMRRERERWLGRKDRGPSPVRSNFDGFADRLTSNRNGNRDRFLVGPVRKQ